MIHQTVELAEQPVSAIMTPLERIVSVPSDSSMSAFLDLARGNSYSRFPVRHAGRAGFAGIVDVLDVITGRPRRAGALDDFVREAVRVRDDTPADDVMPLLRLARQSMGLVTDAQGKVVGLVTIEDILRRIVE